MNAHAVTLPVRAVIRVTALLLSLALGCGGPTAVGAKPFAARPGDTYAARFTVNQVPKDLKFIDHVVYKTVDGLELELTVFLPPERNNKPAPLLLYIHGGGWDSGNRFVVLSSGGIEVFRRMTQLGVVCATIEYRLRSADSNVMEAVADCKDAIHYFVKNAAKYGIDPNRIATMGGSAGGHLALCSALGDDQDYPCDPALGRYRGKVVAVVADFPLVSVVDPKLHFHDNPHWIKGFLRGDASAPRDDAAAAKKLSPLLLLTPSSPAILLAHGDHDSILPVENSIALAEACRDKGVPCKLIVVHNAEHGFRGKDIHPDIAEIAGETSEFLHTYLR